MKASRLFVWKSQKMYAKLEIVLAEIFYLTEEIANERNSNNNI